MTMYIDPSVKFGKNCKIGNFCIIEENVIIGDDVEIKNFVELRSGTIIGNNVYIDSYVRSSGKNRIDNNVILRFGATIAREVWIEEDVFIAPNVMTIYDKELAEKKGGIYIGSGAKIFTAAVLGPSIQIGKNVIIGAQAYVNKDCLKPGTYIGVPARKI